MKSKIKDNKEYIILEIIPTAISPDKGPIAQISALKLKGIHLMDRFDYRLNEELIFNRDILKMIDYDKDKFNYENSSDIIFEKFIKWIGKIDLLIIDNTYTYNYLEKINNKKISIFKYLNLKYSDDVIDKIINKYNLKESNYIVDLLYEALIYESNNKK